MEANELRIGNWVIIDNGIKPKYEYQLTGHDIYELEESNCLHCEGLPISKENLCKIGYEDCTDKCLEGSMWFRKKDMPTIAFNRITKQWEIISLGINLEYELKYIHQLQNFHFLLTYKEIIYEP